MGHNLMARNLVVEFFLVMAFVASLMTITAYKSGFNSAMAKCQAEFNQGGEGYCLADNPPHPGACK